VRVLLNAMGLTLWGAVAITLALCMVVLGYRASLTYRNANVPPSYAPTRSAAPSTAAASYSENMTERKDEGQRNVVSQAAQTANAIRALFRSATENQRYAEAVVYGKELFETGSANADDLTLLVRAYYVQKDCKNVVEWSDKAVSASRRAGERPAAALYETELQCAADAQDNARMIAALESLIRLTNKSTYWNILVRIFRQEERDDRNTLMIYRVMYNTSAMNLGADYIEMAQLLGDAGLPGEAQRVLEKAISSGRVREEQRARTTRLMDSLRARADADRAGLEQEDAQATKSPAGNLYVKLGQVYYGFGDYQQAADAIDRGLKKGGIKHLDEAYVYLGLAEGAIQDNAEAGSAFANLREVPNMSPRVADLWRLYAETNISSMQTLP
jgi:tetratricopeptide (TPR) repeat protein